MPEDRLVIGTEDLLALLDELLEPRQGEWWDGFFRDRDRPCPFFVEWPDVSLVERIESGALTPGPLLELGCGHGRNALFLADRGFEVTAVDFSQTAIDWARERAAAAGLTVDFQCRSIFELEPPERPYDVVYDCGCFHHLAPHRRATYLELVTRRLRPGGVFGLVCFAPEGGSGLSDIEVYAQRRLGGGLGYTEAQLRAVFTGPFRNLELRRMHDMPPESRRFGRSFCWTAWMER